MKIDILCSDPAHPVNAPLAAWAQARGETHEVRILRTPEELEGGDFLFLVSCHRIVKADERARYRHALVLHASALPEGRGMSPHVWQILEGCEALTVTLLVAADGVDTGDIWHQLTFPVAPTELHDEIHAKLFAAELELMDWALANCDRTTPRPQEGTPTHYRRRTPADSAIDPTRPLAEAFDLLRIADPERYPVHFTWRGQRYRLRIDKW